MTATSNDGRPIDVHFALPTVAGGAPPVGIMCTPGSGSMFSIGATTVVCIATDSLRRTDSCRFTVTVVVPPRISATMFTAFGDSITEGLNSTTVKPRYIPNPPGSYPGQLEMLLNDRYTAQTSQVFDEGIGGEKIADGLKRLPNVLMADHPEALLILEGANDLNAGGSAAIPTVVDGLRTMVALGRGSGAVVFLATLLPQRPGGSRAQGAALIEPTNVQISAMAPGSGAVLVDLYAAFGGVAGDLIGSDGLHPNVTGNQKIAETFFEAIRARLEITAAMGIRSRR